MYICIYVYMYVYMYVYIYICVCVWPAGACRPSLSRADDARRLRSHAHRTLLLYVWDGGRLSQMPSKVLVCRSLVLVHKIDVQLEKIILRPPIDRRSPTVRLAQGSYAGTLRYGAAPVCLFVCTCRLLVPWHDRGASMPWRIKQGTKRMRQAACVRYGMA